MNVKHTSHLEDIEALRLRQGIDDVELREEVRRLGPGACVRVTFLGTLRPNETLMVRITRVTGAEFQGKLLQQPSRDVERGLHPGVTVRFRDVHIHSVVRHVEGKAGAGPASLS
jgi:hypothetical protein